jgi:serine protease AprX
MAAAALLPGVGLTVAAGPPGATAASGPSGISNSFSGIWRDGAYTGTSLWDARNMMQMGWGASATLNGHGVGIALIDTGVSPVANLRASQVVNGPDLSFESQAPNLRHLDTYGHGTHMAGIMISSGQADGHHGLATGAKLTSVKVGTANGTVDVSQVIAAIDWVVENKNHDPAFPIRVINLSYGSGGNPSSTTDPLQFAVEQAWKAGIVVVAAAGNENKTMQSSPATDPFILSVGAARTAGTPQNSDDTISTFTNGKKATRSIDLVAPGEGIFSLRVQGSNIDNAYPAARIDDNIFRGSGTSQAAAVTSAVVAVILQARPTLTPDQVKKLLITSGTPLSGLDSYKRMINVNKALATATPTSGQAGTWSNGTGLLESARGPNHVVANGVTLIGNNTIWGPFVPSTWASQSAARTAWVGGVWNGKRLAADGWTGSSWASKTWGPTTWAASSFSGSSWVDPNWSGRFWSGRFWSTGAWNGRFWSSSSWYSAL